MMLFDTSAVLPLFNANDPLHARAVTLFGEIEASGERLLLHNYVISEAVAVMQRRAGHRAASVFLESAPKFDTHWVSRDDHDQACEVFVGRSLRGLSLVDCVSFVVMGRYGITTAFAFDRDFTREGFTLYGDA